MTVRITLRDIAERTGYTVNTVSRALKDKEDIAASLRSGSMKTISAIIPDISDPLFAIWMKEIEMQLKERNFDMFIQNTEEDQELEKRAVRLAIGKKIGGIILCPCQKDESSIYPYLGPQPGQAEKRIEKHGRKRAAQRQRRKNILPGRQRKLVQQRERRAPQSRLARHGDGT